MEYKEIIRIKNNTPVYSIIELNDLRIAIGGYDGCIRIYSVDFRIGEYKVDIECEVHNDRVNSMVNIVNGNKMVSGSADMTVKVWEVSKTEISLIKTLLNHKDYVYTIILLSDNRFASCSRDKTIIIWNSTDSFNEITTLHEQFNVYSILHMKNKQDTLISGGDVNSVCVWNINSYQKETVIECCGAKTLNGIIELNKGLIAVNGGNSYSIDIIDVIMGKVIYKVKDKTFIVGNDYYSSICLLTNEVFVYVHSECLCEVFIKELKIGFKKKIKGEFCGRGAIVVNKGKYILIGDCFDGVTVFEVGNKV